MLLTHFNDYLSVCIPTKKNCDGNMSLDTDIQDLLKGDAALLEHRADENIQVKGGLISLHNADSYGVSPYKDYIRPLTTFYMLYNLP